jgi:alpha/beta superfamily hydrolase
MNKARRMAALQARALAALGYGVLLLDLHGCGDSSGDFGDSLPTPI